MYVRISPIQIISINLTDFSTQLKRTVLCAVRTEFLCSVWMNVSLQRVSVLVNGTFWYWALLFAVYFNHDPYIKELVVNVESVRNTRKILVGKPGAHARYVWALMKKNIKHNVTEIRWLYWTDRDRVCQDFVRVVMNICVYSEYVKRFLGSSIIWHFIVI
jgi:hypothetical protein